MALKGKITTFDNCPHCGSKYGFYRKFYVSGWTMDFRLFEKGGDGENIIENPHMYDQLSCSKYTKYYYCYECDKRICKAEDS